MNKNTFMRPLAAAISGVFLLSACATNPDGSFRLDPRATGALIGAAAGCALGAAADGSKGCLTGAVVGAAAGFLISWYFESKKLADAKQINTEYEQQARRSKGKKAVATAVPKNEIVPAKFETQVKTLPTEKSSEKEIQVTSNTDLVGYGDDVPQVRQRYAIYDENNKLVEEKVEDIAAVDGAGRYQTTSKFKLPAEAKDKKYTVKTALETNDKTYKENTYKISWVDGQAMLLASR